MKDWRRDSEELELVNKVLLKKFYKNGFQKMEREHCELCCSVFGSGKFDFSEGYCTENYYFWICDRCYEEQNELFHWKVKS